jgi:ABC-type lipoprotein release transport system permease subunit
MRLLIGKYAGRLYNKGSAIPVAFWGSRIAARLIGDLSPGNVAPMVFGSLELIALALLAAYIPTRRATRLDPMIALRYE